MKWVKRTFVLVLLVGASALHGTGRARRPARFRVHRFPLRAPAVQYAPNARIVRDGLGARGLPCSRGRPSHVVSGALRPGRTAGPVRGSARLRPRSLPCRDERQRGRFLDRALGRKE